MQRTSSMNTDLTTGYRVRIYPTEEQKSIIMQNIDAVRAVYNIGLEMENESYHSNNGYIGYNRLTKIFGDMRKTSDYRWLKPISIGTIRRALWHLDNAFKKFFNRECRYPKFKSKRRSKKAFPLRSDRTYIRREYIQVSGMPGNMNMILAKKHGIPDNKRLWNCTITYDGYDKFWFSCTIEDESIIIDHGIDITVNPPIGVDVGIVNLATTSDGDFYKYTDTSKLEKRLRRQNRRFQKAIGRYSALCNIDGMRTKYQDIPKSKNYMKLLERRAKTIRKISNIHRNDVHTATKRIVEKYPSTIVIEDISVKKQMRESPWLQSHAPQMRYYETHRQLKYKAYRRGIPVIVADREYPSSQLCSRCGERGKLLNRTFKCPVCGYKEDRDLNAAINLSHLAI